MLEFHSTLLGTNSILPMMIRSVYQQKKDTFFCVFMTFRAERHQIGNITGSAWSKLTLLSRPPFNKSYCFWTESLLLNNTDLLRKNKQSWPLVKGPSSSYLLWKLVWAHVQWIVQWNFRSNSTGRSFLKILGAPIPVLKGDSKWSIYLPSVSEMRGEF